MDTCRIIFPNGYGANIVPDAKHPGYYTLTPIDFKDTIRLDTSVVNHILEGLNYEEVVMTLRQLEDLPFHKEMPY